MTMDLTPLDKTTRLLFSIELQPVQGDRFHHPLRQPPEGDKIRSHLRVADAKKFRLQLCQRQGLPAGDGHGSVVLLVKI